MQSFGGPLTSWISPFFFLAGFDQNLSKSPSLSHAFLDLLRDAASTPLSAILCICVLPPITDPGCSVGKALLSSILFGSVSSTGCEDNVAEESPAGVDRNDEETCVDFRFLGAGVGAGAGSARVERVEMRLVSGMTLNRSIFCNDGVASEQKSIHNPRKVESGYSDETILRKAETDVAMHFRCTVGLLSINRSDDDTVFQRSYYIR